VPLSAASEGFTKLAYRGIFSFIPYYSNIAIFGLICLIVALIIFQMRKTTV